jgi:hypothetical protein
MPGERPLYRERPRTLKGHPCGRARNGSLGMAGGRAEHVRLPTTNSRSRSTFPAATLGADQPLAPIDDGCIGPVPLDELGGVRLDLVLAAAAPHDQPQLGFRRIAERHRRAGFGFHRLREPRGPAGRADPVPPLASIHSITSSARARIDGGTVRPSALAVLRSMTSSNVVGCSTGRSAGLAPLRIFPA